MNEQVVPALGEAPDLPETSHQGSRVLSTCYSACGVREVNQDVAASFQFKMQDAGVITVAAVADGMGGLESGEVAAAEAIHAFSLCFVFSVLLKLQNRVAWEIAHCIERSFHFANNRVMAQARNRQAQGGMGTTLTAGVVEGNTLFVGSVGDSRCYLWREGALNQLTRDDSFVQPLFEQGLLAQEEAENHPRANEITRALGWPEDVKNIPVTTHALADGDLIILCSDGLWKGGHPSLCNACLDLTQQPFTQTNLDQPAVSLVHEALERGSDDNISVAMLWVSNGDRLVLETAATERTKEN